MVFFFFFGIDCNRLISVPNKLQNCHGLSHQTKESQGQRSLVGCHLWGLTEMDSTEVTQQQQQQHIRSLFLTHKLATWDHNLCVEGGINQDQGNYDLHSFLNILTSLLSPLTDAFHDHMRTDILIVEGSVLQVGPTVMSVTSAHIPLVITKPYGRI